MKGMLKKWLRAGVLVSLAFGGVHHEVALAWIPPRIPVPPGPVVCKAEEEYQCNYIPVWPFFVCGCECVDPVRCRT